MSCACAGQGEGAERAGGAPLAAQPQRPAGCEIVAPGRSLQRRVAAAEPGAALCLQPGEHAGPLAVDRPLTLWGPRAARVVSSGEGTTIEVSAAKARLLGFTVDGSGARYDQEDAAVAVRKADGVEVRGLRVVNAVFGILAHQSNDLRIADNRIEGDPDSPRGLRGDAIRLWEVRRSLVEGNHVLDSRDIVIWYSPGNRLARNRVERSRYGTHFMYSHDNAVDGNVYLHNVVGLFVMYSRGLDIYGNDFLGSSEPGGMGLGLKESGSIHARDNRFVHNTSGIYLDTTPLDLANEDRFERNLLTLNDRGIVFHGRADGNRFTDNTLRANRHQVAVEGRGDATAALWRGNYYDDYAGYDLDGDGRGDVPYELRSLSGELVQKHPSLALLRGTPAFAGIEAVGALLPILAPRRLLVDAKPRMHPPQEQRDGA